MRCNHKNSTKTEKIKHGLGAGIQSSTLEPKHFLEIIRHSLSEITLSLLFLSFLPAFASGQDSGDKLTQTIRGVITDAASGEVIPFASVSLADNPEKGAMSEGDGQFRQCTCRTPFG